MVIVLLLLFLNLATNLTMYRARLTEREETADHLRQGALAVSRQVQQSYPNQPTTADLEQSRVRYNLSGLLLVPSRPPQSNRKDQQGWYHEVASQLHPYHADELALVLADGEFNELVRGVVSEFYYMYPVPAGAGHSLVVLSVERPALAYLEDSRTTILMAQVIALLVVGLVYFVLSRFIFRPFRRIRQRAVEAGRQVDESDDETEAVVREYERVIEELKRKEAELVQMNATIRDKADSFEQFNQYLLESGQSGIVTLDSYGRVVAINEIARQILLVDPTVSVGADYSEVFSNATDLRGDVQKILDQNAAPGYREYTGLIADGQNSVHGITVSFIKGRGQDEVGLLILIHDLSELARLREELESSTRLAALGEMAGGLAHQLRNSLGAISGYGHLLKKRLSVESLPIDKADALLSEIREADELIGRFLTFAKPLECSLASVSLGGLLEDAIEQFRVRDDCPDVEFSINGCQDIFVQADAVLMKQVFANVIDNGIKAYERGKPYIEISVSPRGDQAVLEIRDHGSGIPEEDLERIFTPFFSSRPAGTGLGLSLARKIVDLHGGHLSVESELGRGTCFAIHLPCVRSGQESLGVSDLSQQIQK